MVSLVICLEGRERHAAVGDRAKPNRLQRTDLQSRRPSSSVLDTDSKPAVAFATAAMMTEQTNKLRAKQEMTIAKLEILTANPEITDANLEKNFTATEMTMTARGMVSVIRTMVGTEHAASPRWCTTPALLQPTDASLCYCASTRRKRVPQSPTHRIRQPLRRQTGRANS